MSMRYLIAAAAVLLAGCGTRVEPMANGAKTTNAPPCFRTTMEGGLSAAQAACERFGAEIVNVDATAHEVRAVTKDNAVTALIALSDDKTGCIDFNISVVSSTMTWDDDVRAVRALAHYIHDAVAH